MEIDCLDECLVNLDLQQYIEDYIFPKYSKNEPAHDIHHIKYVIQRSFRIARANNLKLNPNMIYVIAAFHDIGHQIDSKTHEIISAEIMFQDSKLLTFFNEAERIIMKEAIEDHRASSNHEPRSIYGKLVSSADRNDSVAQCLKRSYVYGKKLNPRASDEELFENAFEVLLRKFGKDGYAKFFFRDVEYEAFLTEIRKLLKDKNQFCHKQKVYINKLKRNHQL